jgi:hypothetical protein
VEGASRQAIDDESAVHPCPKTSAKSVLVPSPFNLLQKLRNLSDPDSDRQPCLMWSAVTRHRFRAARHVSPAKAFRPVSRAQRDALPVAGLQRCVFCPTGGSALLPTELVLSSASDGLGGGQSCLPVESGVLPPHSIRSAHFVWLKTSPNPMPVSIPIAIPIPISPCPCPPIPVSSSPIRG